MAGSEEAVKREFLEELGRPIRRMRQLCMLENLFTYRGARGHEAVFVFEAELLEPVHDSTDLSFVDGEVTNEVARRPVRGFLAGADRLYPEKLVGYLA